MSAAGGTPAEAVLAVLDAMEAAGVRTWLDGGWGVDALVGRQTRAHRDVDLALDVRHEDAALSALRALGYDIETHERPTRVELAAPGDSGYALREQYRHDLALLRELLERA